MILFLTSEKFICLIPRKSKYSYVFYLKIRRKFQIYNRNGNPFFTKILLKFVT